MKLGLKTSKGTSALLFILTPKSFAYSSGGSIGFTKPSLTSITREQMLRTFNHCNYTGNKAPGGYQTDEGWAGGTNHFKIR